MKKLLNILLILLFLGVFASFVYKTNFAPELISTPANTPAVEKTDEIKSTASVSSSAMAKEEIEGIIKDYLLKNPEVIISAVEELQRKKMEETNKKANEYLKDNISSINEAGQPPFIGSDNPDITVVLFFDYNCSFCKQANVQINKVLEQDKRVKFILRPIPILGDTSMYVAKVALALHKIAPDKFTALHNSLMEMKPINQDSIKRLIEENGIDYAIVENEINSSYIKNTLDKNFELAKNLGVKGAPSQVINGTFVPGLIEAEKYILAFEEIRKAIQNAPAENSQNTNNQGNAPVLESISTQNAAPAVVDQKNPDQNSQLPQPPVNSSDTKVPTNGAVNMNN